MSVSRELLERMCEEIDGVYRLATELGLGTAAQLLAMARLELQLLRHDITDEEFAALRDKARDPSVPH